MVSTAYMVENGTFPSAQCINLSSSPKIDRWIPMTPVELDGAVTSHLFTSLTNSAPGGRPFDARRQSVVAKRGIDNSCNSVVGDLALSTTDLRRSQSKDPQVHGLLQATFSKRTLNLLV